MSRYMIPAGQPLDRRLLKHRRGALTLAAALAAFVPICWIVIHLHGSFPGDSDFISRIRHPTPGNHSPSSPTPSRCSATLAELDGGEARAQASRAALHTATRSPTRIATANTTSSWCVIERFE